MGRIGGYTHWDHTINGDIMPKLQLQLIIHFVIHTSASGEKHVKSIDSYRTPLCFATILQERDPWAVKRRDGMKIFR